MKMRFIKLPAALFAVALVSTGCGLLGTRETARENPNPYPNDLPQAEAVSEADTQYARENLDLRAVGTLLERADNAEEFEYLLNTEGINNLDLNRDGYVDYISVSEFEDRFDDERGLSLFSQFGPDLIQQIATIIFDREGFRDARGTRILLTGDEQLYGDNYYYETSRRDRNLSLVEWLFGDNRDARYRSPYYYGNYPDDYDVFETVETPVYRTRIERIYDADAAPVFIQTSNPTVADNVKIKSPYDGRSVGKNFPKPGKLSREEKELRKNNALAQPEFVPAKKEKIKDFPPARDDRPRGNPNNFERPRKENNAKFEKREKPGKAFREAFKAPKPERPAFNPQPKPNKAEKQSMKPPKPDNNGKPKSGGNNPGGGGGNKGDGNKGGGGGKGGGKKN